MRLLLDRLALAHALAPEPAGWVSDRALVLVRSLRDNYYNRDVLAQNLAEKYGIIRPEWRTDTVGDREMFGLEFTHWRSDSDPRRRRRAWWGVSSGRRSGRLSRSP